MSETSLTSELSAETIASGADAPACAAPVPPTDVQETVVEPVSGWRLVDFAELWRCRELLYFFTWRDVLIRYKQTVLGAAWAIIQPVMMMLVFTIFLGRMAKVDSGSFPYPVFVYAGLLPWTFFSTSITRAGNSVVGAINIVTKVYFPRLLVPFASVGAAAVDFVLAFGILLGLMLFYAVPIGWGMLFVPGLMVLAALAALGAGTILAALNVSYRDFKYVIPFLVQIWMFATPTVYMNVETIADAGAGQPAERAEVASVEGAGEPTGESAGELTGESAGERTGDRVGLAAVQPSAGMEVASVEAADGTAEESGGKATAGESGDSLPALVKTLLHLNPMTGLIAFFRAATLGGPLPWGALGFSAVMIVAMFVCGVLYFRRVEYRFADII
jgi:lipopolysaccharide transport system permease protein